MATATAMAETTEAPSAPGPHLFRDEDQVLHLQAVSEKHIVLRISAHTTLTIQRLAPESGEPVDEASSLL